MPKKLSGDWIDNGNASITAKCAENPRKLPPSDVVHVWYYRGGKAFNQCYTRVSWFLENFTESK